MNEPIAAAEQHRTQRIGWLRAAVLGANDGASTFRGALRVTFWGALAMALTALVGRLFGTVV